MTEVISDESHLELEMDGNLHTTQDDEVVPEANEQEPAKPQSNKDSVQNARNRGKKAQQARKVKIQLPETVKATTTAAAPASNQKKNKSKVAAETVERLIKVTDEAGEIDVEEMTDDDDEEETEGPSQIGSIFISCWTTSSGCLKGACSRGCHLVKKACSIGCHLVIAAVATLKHHFLAWCGQLLFLSCVYLLYSQLLMDTEGYTFSSQDRMEYVLNTSVWMLLPIALVSLLSRYDTHSLHRRFVQAHTAPSLLLLISCLLATTQCDSALLVWIKALLITTGIFRCLHWLTLATRIVSISDCCRPATELHTTVVLTYTAWMMGRQELGCNTPDTATDTEDVHTDRTETSWISMCDVMEQYVCGADHVMTQDYAQ